MWGGPGAGSVPHSPGGPIPVTSPASGAPLYSSRPTLEDLGHQREEGHFRGPTASEVSGGGGGTGRAWYGAACGSAEGGGGHPGTRLNPQVAPWTGSESSLAGPEGFLWGKGQLQGHAETPGPRFCLPQRGSPQPLGLCTQLVPEKVCLCQNSLSVPRKTRRLPQPYQTGSDRATFTLTPAASCGGQGQRWATALVLLPVGPGLHR